MRFLTHLSYALKMLLVFFFFFQAEDGIRDYKVTGVQTCALPILTITAKLGSVTAAISFSITNATIQSITVTPVNQTIPIGWHQQFSATGKFTDSSTQDLTNSVTWNSTTSIVANFGSSAGVILGIKQGTTSVNASFNFGGASATGTTAL